LGGNHYDTGYGITVDNAGCAHVTGNTQSHQFPTADPVQGTNAGSDLFVTKFTAAGNTLSYSTFLGGSSQEYSRSIAVDNQGSAYVTGFTQSSNFPAANPYDDTINSTTDAFVSKLSFCLLPVAGFSAEPIPGIRH
jgi:hypothetical protein